ncbi:MAG: tetratricopeptide repeat protein [Gemmatimonadales bacterium]|nr:tetratricopeptide repeat protein [Gemmatimonadales bacterium]
MTRYSLRLALAATAFFGRPGIAQNVEYTSPAGVRYYAQRDTGAVARAESLLALAPGDVGRIIELGIAQSGVRQYREAIATYTRGLAIEPNNPLLYRYRGHRYISVREFDSAIADLTRGNRLDTTNYDIWYHLGVVQFVRGQFGSAADAFAHAQRLAPNDNELAGSTDWLWMALRRAGRAADAQAALAPISDSMRITSATAYFQRLKLYRGLIGPEQVFTAADTADIAVATLAYGVGNWYLVNGDTARARDWFQRSIASGGWPAFGFIASEVELRRLR